MSTANSPAWTKFQQMKMLAARTVFLTALSALATPSVAVENRRTDPVELRYEITVDADGKATSLKPIGSLPDKIDQWIRSRVRSFSFVPATVNGVAQSAATTLYLTLGIVESAGAKAGYGITSLSTGPRLKKGQYKYLPQSSGAAYFVVAFDRKGRVTEAAIDEAVSPPSNRDFRGWGTVVAKSFRIEPETVGGIAMPGRARIPIRFCAYGDRACPQLERLKTSEGSNLGGDMIADSVLKLRSPLPGG